MTSTTSPPPLADVRVPDGAVANDLGPDGAGVLFDGVTKRYGRQTVLDVPRLDVPHRSFTVLVGPSGCGKSTGLRVIAGLETPDSGRVVIGGVDVTGVAPGRRGVSMVFQDFALYPHLTVEQNISFSLRLEARHNRRDGPSKADIARRVTEACAMLGLEKLRGRRPAQLSGGERQRVGLARAVVRRPSVLLLDEPLSALDAQLRQHARAELVRLHRELGNTVVLVTHDQLEALSMGTNLVVMNAGKVVQSGTPGEVYRRPADVFVARFVGSPAMNLHDVRTGPHPAGTELTAPGLRAVIPGGGLPAEVRLGWRPGDGVLDRLPDGGPAAGGEPSGPGLRADGVVDVVEFTGDAVVVHCAGELGRWSVAVRAGVDQPVVGDRVRTTVAAAHLHLFDATTGHRVDGPAD
ncbi:ABC transporter ATP-binding protein [Parafrankia discariae]|uniref:ABC transporter ATP-binding protein n=1 Tax=Parafrankia discariae TaxID=365528 RepID=UPI000374656B|nr:ABC transporter ATP-binding protein [Parafrankia discariae]